MCGISGLMNNGSRPSAELALGELEPLAGALLPILLALMLARIACQVAHALQLPAQFEIEIAQGASDAQTDRASLTCDTAAIGQYQNVELLRRFGGLERLPAK